MPVPGFAGAFASQWDELWLGGTKFPGIATVSGSGIKRKLDVKNPKGAAGASLKDEGDELSRFDVTLKLWTDAQKDEFEALLPTIHPRRKGGPRSPLDIYHPSTEMLGIRQIYIEQIPIPKQNKREGTIEVELKCIEWVPAPKPINKGAGAKGKNKDDDVEGGWDEERRRKQDLIDAGVDTMMANAAEGKGDDYNTFMQNESNHMANSV